MAKRILIIEDELDILKMTEFRVKRAGYEVVSATDGQAGLDQAAKANPDLILLDYKLPGMDGIAVYGKLQENEDLRGIPVVFLSASKGTEELIEKMAEIGAEHSMNKPYDPKDLIDKIKELIGE